MHKLRLITQSPEQTQKLGLYMGTMALGNEIYLLTGNLGTGKTCLVQGIASGLGIKEHTCSPSFMIAREYQGRLKLYHLDLYRLDNIKEIADLGIDEYFGHDAVCAIEWAEKGSAILPRDNLTVHLEHMAENQRKITFEPKGQSYAEMVTKLKFTLENDKEGKWSFL
jgi:tRNA threonylcarbamoyladenosine biosynthesis protein TsaE